MLGSSRVITTNTGAVCYDADFYPYAGEISVTNTCPQSYKFTDYERDAETGLDYAIARYYSSRLGRFLSTDPLGGAVGNPQSHNAYSYVANDPVNYIDALGLDSCRKPTPNGCFPVAPSGTCSGESCLRQPTEGNTIFDAIAGAPGTYIYFDDHGRLQWGYSFDAAHNPFIVRFTGTLYGRCCYDMYFNTLEEYLDWRSYVASLPQSRRWALQESVYKVFLLIAKNEGLDPNASFSVQFRNKALVTSVRRDCKPGDCLVDESNLTGWWKDPITWFHQGDASWYQGFFFDTPHLIGSDPISAHIDPFGPLNPLHYLIQIPAMLFPGGPIGNATCSINGGCTVH